MTRARAGAHGGLVLAVLLTLVAVLSACGGDIDSTRITTTARTAPPSPDEAAVEQAYSEFITAFFGGAASAACGLLTKRARQELAADGRCEERARAAAESARSYYPELELTVDEVVVNGDAATLTATFESTAGPQQTRVTLLREGDRWRVDRNEDD